MHSAFDVSMHNKRLTLCAVKGREPRLEPHLETPGASPGAAPGARQARGARARAARDCVSRAAAHQRVADSAAGVRAAGGERLRQRAVHARPAPVLVVVGSPPLLLLFHVCGAHTQRLAALTGAHLLVTAGFLADARRFERQLVSSTTLVALAAVLMASPRPTSMTACVLTTCAATYCGALLALAALQVIGMLDVMPGAP